MRDIRKSSDAADSLVRSAHAPGRYWDSTYERRGFAGVSWFQEEPTTSMELIAGTGVLRSAPVIDVGGGASCLVDRLVAGGFADVSVLDVSAVAVGEARQRLGPAAPVHWLIQDLLAWRPTRRYALWHDRAVFHFFVSEEQKEGYRRVLQSAVEPGGSVVIGAFASDGPTSCSGLPVARYSAEDLAKALGPGFAITAARREAHTTPSGALQPFTWVAAERSDQTRLGAGRG